MIFYRKTSPRGDTLIEVIFAFAILATIIGFAYSGSIQARKAALSSQQRTQALLAAQFQSQAIKGYRDSLPWDGSTGEFPNFLNTGGGGGIPLNTTSKYCMSPSSNASPVPPKTGPRFEWQLLLDTDPGCTNLVAFVLPQLPTPPSPDTKLSITFQPGKATCSDIITCDSVQAVVKVTWLDPYKTTSSVQNIVILTKND